MLKTAVIGATGYIGSFLLNRYREFFPDCIGTGFSRTRNDLIPFDLAHPEITALNLKETGHQAVIIASARSSVVWCESHQKEAYDVNVRGTLKLVEQLEKSSLTTIFLSSDYVFDGQKGNYSDQAETNPTTEYGKQKAEVEREIPNLTKNYIILRLSKIYGTQWQDGTLLDTLANSLMKGQEVEAAKDKIFNPTHLNDFAAMVFFIQQQKVSGLFNLCNSHFYSRHQITCKLTQALGMPLTQVKPIFLRENLALKHIPLNTSLISSSIFDKLQSSFLSLDEAIHRIASNWNGKL